MLQLQEQRDLGCRDQMEQLAVLELDLQQLELGPRFQVAHVRVEAEARDFRVDLHSGEPLEPGPHPLERFVEYWSLLRRDGARSVEAPGLLEQRCPNCGASIEGEGRVATCGSCEALLRSGEHDWVLAEITQEEAWRDPGERHGEVPGLEPMRSRDPQLSVQALEDRASVAFFRLAAAWRLGDVTPVRKLALDRFCEELQQRLSGQERPRRFDGDCAVGAVELLAVAFGDDALDRAALQLSWTARPMEAVPGASRPARGGEFTRRESLMVLARRSTVVTDLRHALTSTHCPGCDAPETSAAADACEHCGAVLNDGFHHWVLQHFVAQDSAEGRELARQLLDDAGAGAD